MKKTHVISLYDFTGEALRPWAEAGYQCFAYDIQHKPSPMGELEPSSGTAFENLDSHFPLNGGNIFKIHADLYNESVLMKIASRHMNDAKFLSAFPPCTDLSSAGARWWKEKEKENPLFQMFARDNAVACQHLADTLDCPYYIENPVGALSTLWRKPNHSFNPCDYGGYLPEDDVHPRYPEYIPPRDAYRKKTCLWSGNRFTMPEINPVQHETLVYKRKDPTKSGNFSPVHGRTGGKSLKTKNIRSATPRGFAKAVFKANEFHC
jgi:hypothetical protein|tara:strand:- start:378 stop:1169 length:792 start_codon:yes stop_codon:yes gene_type:complete